MILAQTGTRIGYFLTSTIIYTAVLGLLISAIIETFF